MSLGQRLKESSMTLCWPWGHPQKMVFSMTSTPLIPEWSMKQTTLSWRRKSKTSWNLVSGSRDWSSPRKKHLSCLSTIDSRPISSRLRSLKVLSPRFIKSEISLICAQDLIFSIRGMSRASQLQSTLHPTGWETPRRITFRGYTGSHSLKKVCLRNSLSREKKQSWGIIESSDRIKACTSFTSWHLEVHSSSSMGPRSTINWSIWWGMSILREATRRWSRRTCFTLTCGKCQGITKTTKKTSLCLKLMRITVMIRDVRNILLGKLLDLSPWTVPGIAWYSRTHLTHIRNYQLESQILECSIGMRSVVRSLAWQESAGFNRMMPTSFAGRIRLPTRFSAASNSLTTFMASSDSNGKSSSQQGPNIQWAATNSGKRQRANWSKRLILTVSPGNITKEMELFTGRRLILLSTMLLGALSSAELFSLISNCPSGLTYNTLHPTKMKKQECKNTNSWGRTYIHLMSSAIRLSNGKM